MEAEIEQQYASLLAHLRHRVESQEFLERHRQNERDFSRRRALPFVMVIYTLVNLLKRALQDELDELFRLFNGAEVATRAVSKSAFCQARQKVKPSAFIELNQAQVEHFYEHFAVQRWQGYRLLAIDGTLLDVPNTALNRATFGSWGSRHGTHTAKARAWQLFDVLNHITLDGSLAPKEEGERCLAEAHLAQVQAGDLLLLDRGYPAYWLFFAILARGAEFCARLPVAQWQPAYALVASGQGEQVLHLPLCAPSRALCRAHGFDHATLMLRLIRVELPDGEVEVLATSLYDTQRYPASCFGELYQQRWPVEEDYKRLKLRLEVENWSGLTPLALRQDFYASLFTKNLAAILAHPAQQVVAIQTAARTHPYQVNMTNLLSKLKDTVVLFFTRTDLRPYLHALWLQMTRTIEPIRKGRSFPRKPAVRPPRFSTSYKPTR